MTTLYSEEQVLVLVARLSRNQLVSFVNARIVTPVSSATGVVFRPIDVARLQLLCDLTEQFDLDDDGLAVVVSLVDQLHGVRAELRAIIDALAQEHADVRTRVGEAMTAARLRPITPIADV